MYTKLKKKKRRYKKKVKIWSKWKSTQKIVTVEIFLLFLLSRFFNCSMQDTRIKLFMAAKRLRMGPVTQWPAFFLGNYHHFLRIIRYVFPGTATFTCRGIEVGQWRDSNERQDIGDSDPSLYFIVNFKVYSSFR